MTTINARLGWTSHGDQSSPLLTLPAEIIRMILRFARKDQVWGRHSMYSCAAACRELFEHSDDILWEIVPKLSLDRFHKGKGNSFIRHVTGRFAGLAGGTTAVTGPLSYTKALALHIDAKEYGKATARVDLNLKTLATTYPSNQNLEILTVTPDTVFHKAAQFEAFRNILAGKSNVRIVYLPKLMPQPELVRNRSSVAVCIQTSPPAAPGFDLYLEHGTDLDNAHELFPNNDNNSIHKISFFGADDTDSFSITNFCGSMDFKEKTVVDSLRFLNIRRIAGLRYWDFSRLTVVELHDCDRINAALKVMAEDTTLLVRLIVAWSGYAKNSRLPNLSSEACMHLSKILRINNRLKELSICVHELQRCRHQDFVADLPSTMEYLAVIQSSGDFFDVADYEALSKRCVNIRGIGTTMHFATKSDAAALEQYSRPQVAQMITALRQMRHLEYVSIIRFAKPKEEYPAELASYLYDLAGAQHLDEILANYDAQLDDYDADCADSDTSKLEHGDFNFMISVCCRLPKYAKSAKRALGNHFKIDLLGNVVKFKPTDYDVVRNLRFLSALFGRNMSEFAKEDGVRYQFESSEYGCTEIGWGSGGKSLVKV